MAQKINFGSSVTLDEAVAIIEAVPTNRVAVEGEPGVGKSWLLKTLGERNPTYNLAYIDVPNMDIGDTAMPVIDRENEITKYFPNGRFKLSEDTPTIIMLDEFSKGMQPVKNMLHPLLEQNNPRLGDKTLHPDSIVFTTGNLGSDGVGDIMPAHTIGRLTRVRVSKPDAEQWCSWGLNNGIDGAVLAFVDKYPQVLASYLDEGEDDNNYIFNPRKGGNASYASPRSLAMASAWVAARHKLPTTNALLQSARDMQAFIHYQDQLPTWDSIINDPKNAIVPDGAGACSVMVYGSIQKIDKNTIDPFMTYLRRYKEEWQAAFAINVAKNPQRQMIAFRNAEFKKWVLDNEDLLDA